MSTISNRAIVTAFLTSAGPIQRASCQRYLELFNEGMRQPPNAGRENELNALLDTLDRGTGTDQTAGEVYAKRVNQLDAWVALGPAFAGSLRAIQELLNCWTFVAREELMGNVVAVGAAEYANGTVKLAFWMWTLAATLAMGRGEWELADSVIEELIVEVDRTAGAGYCADIVTRLVAACQSRSQEEAILAWLNWPPVRLFCYFAPLMPSFEPFSGGSLAFWDRATPPVPGGEASALPLQSGPARRILEDFSEGNLGRLSAIDGRTAEAFNRMLLLFLPHLSMNTDAARGEKLRAIIERLSDDVEAASRDRGRLPAVVEELEAATQLGPEFFFYPGAIAALLYAYLLTEDEHLFMGSALALATFSHATSFRRSAALVGSVVGVAAARGQWDLARFAIEHTTAAEHGSETDTVLRGEIDQRLSALSTAIERRDFDAVMGDPHEMA